MPQATGAQAKFNIYDEDVYGQDPGAPDGEQLYVTNFGITSSKGRTQSATLTDSRAATRPTLANEDAGGDLGVEVAPESVGKLLKHTMGGLVTTGAGPYTHTLTIDDLPVSFMAEKDYGVNISGNGRFEKYNGCRVNSAKFSFPQEGAPKCSFSIKGSGMTQAAAALDPTITDNGHNIFSAFETSIEEGGAPSTVITNLDLDVSNNLDEAGYVIGGGGKRKQLPEGLAVITGQYTALFESTALLNKAINNVESSLKITLTRGDGLGTAGNESLEFLLSQLVYEQQSPPIEGPSGVLITMAFTGYLKAGDNGLVITLKNSLATI